MPLHRREEFRGWRRDGGQECLDVIDLGRNGDLRQQMDQGLRDAEFGLVLLTPEFFRKGWTVQELDGMFALEQPGETWILPVWAGVGYQDVLAYSPMLAIRSAAVLAGDSDDGLADVAAKIADSVVELSGLRSPAHYIRAQIATGIEWVNRELFAQSFRIYDELYETKFAFTDLQIFPNMQPRDPISGVRVLPFSELFRAGAALDGARIATTGYQAADTVNVLDERTRAEHLEAAGMQDASGHSIVSYVFQLVDDLTNVGRLCYVHCIGFYDSNTWGVWPVRPEGLALHSAGCRPRSGHRPHAEPPTSPGRLRGRKRNPVHGPGRPGRRRAP